MVMNFCRFGKKVYLNMRILCAEKVFDFIRMSNVQLEAIATLLVEFPERRNFK